MPRVEAAGEVTVISAIESSFAVNLVVVLMPLSLIAQDDPVDPRPIPDATAQQREIDLLIGPRFHCVPRWPDALNGGHQEGWVIVEFTISTEGSPVHYRVVDSSPADVFDEVALEAIAKCAFEPVVVDGEIVELAGAQIRFLFEL